MTTFKLQGSASYRGRTDGPYHMDFENNECQVAGKLSVDPTQPKGPIDGQATLDFEPLPGDKKTLSFRMSMGTHVEHVIALQPTAFDRTRMLCRVCIGGGSWIEDLEASLSAFSLSPKELQLKGELELPFAAFTESADEVSHNTQLL